MANVVIYRRRIPEFVVSGKPLGRHVHKDSRSLQYPFVPRQAKALSPVLWHLNIPVLDQGDLGSCTGNALVDVMGSDPVYETLPAGHPVLDETLAVKIYSLATTLDPYPGQYPPTDTGSDGIDASKAAQQMGLISGYTHCTDIATMQQALMQQPVAIGINWYSSFDNPRASDGYVEIAKSAYVRGGHEVAVVAMDPTAQMFVAQNSWSRSWGVNGTFKFSFATMERLLSEEGDCTVPLPLSTPPPPPAPEPVALPRELELAQTAIPWAGQHRTRSDLVKLQQAIWKWQGRAGIE